SPLQHAPDCSLFFRISLAVWHENSDEVASTLPPGGLSRFVCPGRRQNVRRAGMAVQSGKAKQWSAVQKLCHLGPVALPRMYRREQHFEDSRLTEPHCQFHSETKTGCPRGKQTGHSVLVATLHRATQRCHTVLVRLVEP
ncbi:unnamed protein product, partial [Ectocarpus sp. 12 AP-2014]